MERKRERERQRQRERERDRERESTHMEALHPPPSQLTRNLNMSTERRRGDNITWQLEWQRCSIPVHPLRVLCYYRTDLHYSPPPLDPGAQIINSCSERERERERGGGRRDRDREKATETERKRQRERQRGGRERGR